MLQRLVFVLAMLLSYYNRKYQYSGCSLLLHPRWSTASELKIVGYVDICGTNVVCRHLVKLHVLGNDMHNANYHWVWYKRNMLGMINSIA